MSDNIKSVLTTLLDLTIIVMTTLVLAHSMGALTGFPKGFDAFGHLSQIRILVRYFPHIKWNHLWYSGLPVLQRSYPPLFYLLGAGLAAILPISIPSTILLLSALSHFVRLWGDSHLHGKQTLGVLRRRPHYLLSSVMRSPGWKRSL